MTSQLQPPVLKRRAWVLWFFAALFYGYQFLLRVSPGVMSDELIQYYQIDATQLGLLTSFYYYTYVGMQLPLGVLIDKLGSERLISFAALLLGAASALFAFAPNLYIASLARLLMGGCSACGWIGCVILASRWFAPQQKSLMISLTMGIGTLGAMLGGLPLDVFISFVGWKMALKMLSFGGLVIGAAVFLTMQSIPKNQFPQSIDVAAPASSILEALSTITRQPRCWLVPLYAMMMWFPISVIGDQWGVSFLERSYQIEEGFSATFIALLFLGVSVGGPLFALLSRMSQSYTIPLFLGAILCFLIYSIIIFVPNLPPWFLYVLFLFAGICFTSQLLSFSIMTDITPPAINGVAMAFTNMIIMTSGIIGLPAIGWVLDWSAGDVGSLGMSGYTAQDFKLAFMVIPACMILACFVSLRIRAPYPKF